MTTAVTADQWVAQYGQMPLAPRRPAGTGVARPDNELGAGTDQEAVQAYLRSQDFTAQRQRFILGELARWTWFLSKRGLRSLGGVTVQDVIDYRNWMRTRPREHAPEDVGPPAPLFIGAGQFNPAWRPFKADGEPLAPATLDASLAVLRKLYAFLRKAKYLDSKAFDLIPATSRQSHAQTGDVAMDDAYLKALSFNALLAIGDYLNSPQYRGGPRKRAADRWLVHLLFATAHRVEAATALTDRHLVEVAPGIVELRVVGKRSRSLIQPWTDELQAGLEQYRAALDLHWPPAPGESRYLYCGLHDPRCIETGMSRTQLYRSIRRIGQATARWIETTNATSLSEAELQKLRTLHPHVMRHSTATIEVNVFKDRLEDAQEHLGHVSLATTGLYKHRANWSDTGVTPEEARRLLREVFLRTEPDPE